MQISNAERMESFYNTQLFREEIKGLSPAEVLKLYDELGELKIHHTMLDNTLALEEVEEKQRILVNHIHSSKELSASFSQRYKSAGQETSQDVMDWLEGGTEIEQGETSPLQQKEAKLSSLEATENTISEVEKLIAQKENEGQTI